MYPLNVVDFGDKHIAADVEIPSPYGFTLEIAKGSRNAKKVVIRFFCLYP